jgi:hypothetical protein
MLRSHAKGLAERFVTADVSGAANAALVASHAVGGAMAPKQALETLALDRTVTSECDGAHSS